LCKFIFCAFKCRHCHKCNHNFVITSCTANAVLIIIRITIIVFLVVNNCFIFCSDIESGNPYTLIEGNTIISNNTYRYNTIEQLILLFKYSFAFIDVIRLDVVSLLLLVSFSYNIIVRKLCRGFYSSYCCLFLGGCCSLTLSHHSTFN